MALTDVQMPGLMDGAKLMHYVRRRSPPTLLIVSSGAVRVTASELPDRTLFVAKPFDPKYVLEENNRLTI